MAQTFKYGNGVWATKEGSSLAFNDQDGHYKPLPFTTTRASSATRVNKQGLIEVVGNDRARIDYSETSKGALLLEPSRTNIMLYSEEFDNSYWVKNNATVLADNAISLDGTQNADKITFLTSSGEIVRTTTFTSGVQYTMSFYAKTESGTLTFDYGNIDYAVVRGTATDEWQRFVVTQTAPATTRFPKIQTTETGSLLLWGLQIEQGSYATSYIPTSGSTATRQADTANGAGVANVFNDSEGVLYAEISALADDSTSRRISISDGTTGNRLTLELTSTSNTVRTFMFNGTTTMDMSYVVSSATLNNKIATKYKTNDFALWINGFEIDTDYIGAVASGFEELTFDDGGGSLPFYGKTKEIGVYDTALTDAELEYLTSYRSWEEMVTELNLTIK